MHHPHPQLPLLLHLLLLLLLPLPPLLQMWLPISLVASQGLPVAAWPLACHPAVKLLCWSAKGWACPGQPPPLLLRSAAACGWAGLR